MEERLKNIILDKLLEINNNSLVFLEFNKYLDFKSWFLKYFKKYNKNYTKRDLLRIWQDFEKDYVITLKIKNYEYEE